jgi:hypothetical protein
MRRLTQTCRQFRTGNDTPALDHQTSPPTEAQVPSSATAGAPKWERRPKKVRKL